MIGSADPIEYVDAVLFFVRIGFVSIDEVDGYMKMFEYYLLRREEA